MAIDQKSINFWGRGVGYGILIWIIIYIISIILIYYGVYQNALAGIIVAIIAGIVSYLFALATKPGTTNSALIYGAIWAAAGIILDLVITRMFFPDIFFYWAYWLEYLFILLAPILTVMKMRSMIE